MTIVYGMTGFCIFFGTYVRNIFQNLLMKAAVEIVFVLVWASFDM